MNRSYRMMGAVGILAIGLIGWGVHYQIASQPQWAGKTLSEWLECLDGRGQEVQDARMAIQRMGPATIPYLRKELCAHDPVWKKELEVLLRKQSYVQVQFTKDSVRRSRAVKACKVLKLQARPLIPELAEALGYGTSEAIRVLESFGSEGIWALTQALTNAPGCGAPYGTALALGSMGAMARMAVTNLVWEFENYSVSYPRTASAGSLGVICGGVITLQGGTNEADVVYAKEALLSGLTNDLWVIRRVSAEALIHFTGHEVEVRNHLVKRLEDPQERVRQSVTNALLILAQKGP